MRTLPCYRKLIKPEFNSTSSTVHAIKVHQSPPSGGLPRLKYSKVIGVADQDAPKEFQRQDSIVGGCAGDSF
jgi:hypothetical protein